LMAYPVMPVTRKKEPAFSKVSPPFVAEAFQPRPS
jgi:hypothetical protein